MNKIIFLMFNTSKPTYDYFLFLVTRNDNLLFYYAFAHTCLILHINVFLDKERLTN